MIQNSNNWWIPWYITKLRVCCKTANRPTWQVHIDTTLSPKKASSLSKLIFSCTKSVEGRDIQQCVVSYVMLQDVTANSPDPSRNGSMYTVPKTLTATTRYEGGTPWRLWVAADTAWPSRCPCFWPLMLYSKCCKQLLGCRTSNIFVLFLICTMTRPANLMNEITSSVPGSLH